MSSLSKTLNELFLAAKSGRDRSYSPYSNHKVGAAIRTSDGKIFSGSNIENSSYGGTVCAERVAIWKAVSEGHRKIAEVFVVTDTDPPWPPCGICRQVISEFADGNISVHTANLSGQLESMKFNDILPKAFTPAYLKR